MVRARSSISLGFAVLVIIVVVLIAGLGVYLGTTFKSVPPRITTTASFSGSYTITFEQIGACNPPFVGVPWSVTVGNTAKVQPLNAPLPLNNYSLSGSIDEANSNITFALTNGNYSYTVEPTAGFFTPDTGAFMVSDSNFTIQIRYTGTSCTATLNTESANTSTITFTSNSTTASSASTICTIMGQPGGIQLRVISDSTSTPIAGAKVYATDNPDLCNNSPATSQTTLTFTTSNATWYSLPSDNVGSYSFSVSYSGQNYTFSAALRPVSLTCATLYLTSGHSNVTITEFGSTC